MPIRPSQPAMLALTPWSLHERPLEPRSRRAAPRRRRLVRGAIAAAAVAALLAAAAPAFSITCSVPGSYSTVGAALLDVTCTEITLAAQSYAESPVLDRDVTITGVGSTATTIVGQVTVSGAGTVASLAALEVDATAVLGVLEAIAVGSGAEAALSNVIARGPAPSTEIFSDGFESGDTSAWQVVVP